MTIRNQELADRFEELADYLEIEGENPFKIRAYRNAARTISDHPTELFREVAEGHDLTTISGIGKEIAAKIISVVETGKLPALENIRAKFPPDLPKLLRLPGLGPKRVKILLDVLKITSLDDLVKAAEQGKIREIAGFGAKLEKSLLDAAAKQIDTSVRYLRAKVVGHVEDVIELLKSVPGVEKVEAAGSYRRGKETVGDLDFLVVARDGPSVMEAFTSIPNVDRVLAKGETKGSILLKNGIQADLRLVDEKSFGAAWHYFTGSKAHNIATRRRAQQLGLKQNEYGIFRDEEYIAGKSEEEVFKALGLSWIPPEIREDSGEIEAAEKGPLPKLIEEDDLKGDLHNHTTWSDGSASIEEVALKAKSMGWNYIAITDHSKRLTVANGLTEERLEKQIAEIDRINDAIPGIRILKGSEVDILEDGSLDLPDSILKQLDVVIISVHSKFNLDREKQTMRICKALDHPYVTFLAHPTGRLLLERDPYDVDMDRVLEHIRDRGCFVELNAHPIRLDLNEIYLRKAKALGIPVVINNDAHSFNDFLHHRHGICQARRGWLEKGDVINSLPLNQLEKKLKSTFR